MSTRCKYKSHSSRKRKRDLKHVRCISKIAQREVDEIELLSRKPNALEDFKSKYPKGTVTKDNPLGIITHSCNTCKNFVSHGIENECLVTDAYCFKTPYYCEFWELFI